MELMGAVSGVVVGYGAVSGVDGLEGKLGMYGAEEGVWGISSEPLSDIKAKLTPINLNIVSFCIFFSIICNGCPFICPLFITICILRQKALFKSNYYYHYYYYYRENIL